MSNNTVVVYEADKAVREAVKNIVEAEGYEVVVASGLEDLLMLLTVHNPWLLIIAEDAVGIDSIHQLQEKTRTPTTATIVLELWYEGMHPIPFGANFSLPKPCSPRMLRAFMHRLRDTWQQKQDAEDS